MYDPITVLVIVFGLFFCRSFPFLVFSDQRSSFSVCCKASLVVLNSLNFCLSGKLLISPSNLKENLAGQSILGCRFFSFITLNTSCHSLLACRVSVEKSADRLMGVPLYVICHFSLVAFNILTLSLIFVSVITMCLCVFLLGFILPGALFFLDLVDYFLSPCQGSFYLSSLQIFSQVLFLSLLLGPL